MTQPLAAESLDRLSACKRSWLTAGILIYGTLPLSAGRSSTFTSYREILIDGTSGLFAKQPGERRQQETDDEASHDGKIKTEVSLCVMNVAGQAAEPAASHARPKQETDSAKYQPEQKHDFTQIIHNWLIILELQYMPRIKDDTVRLT
jgi:hypothetical protein